MNWPPVFHLQWLDHVPHSRQHLPTTIVWNSPMRELIGSVMVSSLLLPSFGTLSLLLYFRLPSTFLPSKGRSITTLGTGWHDFFIILFRYFIKLFYSFHYISFSFLNGCRLEKGHIVPVLCYHLYKKKNLSGLSLIYLMFCLWYIYIYIYIYICVCAYVCVCVCVCTCVCAYIYIYIYIYMCVCVCVCVFIYIYIYIYIYYINPVNVTVASLALSSS